MLGTILKIGASTCIGAFATGAALLIIGQQKTNQDSAGYNG